MVCPPGGLKFGHLWTKAMYQWLSKRGKGGHMSHVPTLYGVPNQLNSEHQIGLRVVEWVALIRFLFGMWHYSYTLDYAFLF